MNTGLYISVEQIIASAKLKLRLQDSADADNYLELMILQGNKIIGSLESFVIVNYKAPICDNKFQVPSNLHNIIAMRFSGDKAKDSEGKDIPVAYSFGLYINQPFIDSLGLNVDLSGNITVKGGYQMVGDEIIFNIDTPYKNVELSYLGYHTDELGRPYIYQDAEMALAAYAAYQYAMSFPERFLPMQISEWKSEWMAQCKWVKGTAAVRNFKNNKSDVRAKMAALINTKNLFVNQYG